MKSTSSFADYVAASRVLHSWRTYGVKKALCSLADECSFTNQGPLLYELSCRLNGLPGPHLLVDGLWFSRPYGGITRVWNQILGAWLLPGLNSPLAPITLIDRDSSLSITRKFPTVKAQYFDPLDCSQVSLSSEENTSLIRDLNVDAFCSSWISSSSTSSPVCAEVALFHDCLPERYQPRDPALLPLRHRWWSGASAYLAVSADTAEDLTSSFDCADRPIAWCHPSPDPIFSETYYVRNFDVLWQKLRVQANIRSPFVLLPATSAVGTYKNPELVGLALSDNRLRSVQLVLSGVGAEQRSVQLENRFPNLRGRISSVGLNDTELALVYRHALAVLIPSRIEGFGLPAIEVMAAGGLPLVADSRGLRESGAEAAMRFSPDQPQQLIGLLQLLLDPTSRSWLKNRLQPRTEARLTRLNPDLLGLCLLAQVRLASA